MGERLYRSRSDRMLAGVAGGLAEVWDVDPSVVRLIWALLIFFTGGVFLIAYIVMAFVVPDEYELYPQESGGQGPDGTTGTTALTDPSAASHQARLEARAARRAAREARGASTPVGLIVGGFLVLLGAFFLIRELLPSIDFDFVWPLLLVAIGLVLVVSAMGRGPRSGAPQ